MKKIELLPTVENLYQSFIDDSIGRNTDLCYFIDFLDSIEENYSIALDGSWGSGKTFFVKQAEMILSASNEFYKSEYLDYKDDIIKTYCSFCGRTGIETKDNLLVPIYYDAWKYDNEDDPILSIVYEIITILDNEYDFEKDLNASDVFGGIIKEFTKIDIKDFKPSDDFKSIKSTRSIKERIDSFFDNTLVERGNKLVIFIDELDRCKPTYAIKLLERIKHYFNHNNIVFVFSTNLEELQHSVKTVYGSEFSAYRYLDRFFDLKIQMPIVDNEKYYNYISGKGSDVFFDRICKIIIEKYHFELRDQIKFFQYLQSTSFYLAKNSSMYDEYSLCLHFLSPIIIALYIYDFDTYKGFISGNNIQPLEYIVHDSRLFKAFFKCYYEVNVSLEESQKCEFEIEIEGIKKTSKEYLNELYKAIFPIDIKTNGYINVGYLVITNETKNYLQRITSAISRDAYRNKMQSKNGGGTK